jgi:peptidoglycan/LPS O-acetylase OafA/YrhL
LYLDLLRFSAALVVFLSHFSRRDFGGQWFWRLQPIGHYAVIVFFVLSGFVIAYTADKKEHTLTEFASSRFARLYSVVLPTLVLTYCLDHLGIIRNPGGYTLSDDTDPALRLATAALFLSHTWYWNLTLFSNSSYWSLPYEFWYYAIFAGAFYLEGRVRFAWVAICAAVAGPNILLLLPVWLSGVFAYRYRERVRLDGETALMAFAGSGALFGIVIAAELLGLVHHATTRYLPLGFTVYDYLLGVLVAANLMLADHVALPLARSATYIRTAAAFTFSIYLYHLPLLQAIAAYAPASLPPVARGSLIFGVTAAAIVALGAVTERKKHVAKKMVDYAFATVLQLAAVNNQKTGTNLVPRVTKDNTSPQD